MTTNAPRVSDEDLMSYLDGMIEADRRAAVERQLAEDPQARARLEEWRHQNEMIEALYAPVVQEPVPAHLHPVQIAGRQRAQWRHWGQLATAAVTCLAIGAGGGWFAGQQGTTGTRTAEGQVIASALAAHRLYTPEVLHPVEVKGNPEDHLAHWLSKRLDRRLVIPDLTEAGLTLVGGSLLPSGEGPAAQIMYEDRQGRRITLFVTPVGAGPETAPRFVRSGDLQALNWRDATLDCTIVGDVARKVLNTIAGAVYSQLG